MVCYISVLLLHRENKKRRGNELYQDQDYVKATYSYQKSVGMHILVMLFMMYNAVGGCKQFRAI